MALNHPSRRRLVGIAVLFILVCQGAGLIGALATSAGEGSWYDALAKPSFTPPGWVFGPVWTTLYTLMGLAAFFVWTAARWRPEGQAALAWFGLQLVLNLFWSPVFFGLEQVGAGAVLIVLLALAVAETTRRFFRVARRAGWLLVPYLLWVLFAAALNLAIWGMN